jgi:hypothetical protein
VKTETVRQIPSIVPAYFDSAPIATVHVVAAIFAGNKKAAISSMAAFLKSLDSSLRLNLSFAGSGAH